MFRINAPKPPKQSIITLEFLRTSFNTLSDIEQIILQILSVVDVSVTRTALIKCLAKLDVKTSKGTRYTTQTITPPLVKLESLKLINSADYPTPNSSISDLVLKFSAQTRNLDSTVDVIESMEQSSQPLIGKAYGKEAAIVRKVRLAFFLNDTETFQKVFFGTMQKWSEKSFIRRTLIRFTNHISENSALGKLPDAIKLFSAKQTLLLAIENLTDCNADFEFMLNICNKSESLMTEYRSILAVQLIYRARFKEVAKLLINANSYADYILKGWLAFIQGQHDLALQYYQSAHQKKSVSVSYSIEHYANFFYMAELLRRDNETSLSECEFLLHRYVGINFGEIADVFRKAIQMRLRPDYQVSSHYHLNVNDMDLPIIQLFTHLGDIWFETDYCFSHSLHNLFQKVNVAGYTWFAGEIADTLLHSQFCPDEYKKDLQAARSKAEKLGVKTHLYGIMKKKADWQRVLDGLQKFTPDVPPAASKAVKIKFSTTRLVWFLSLNSGYCTLKPKEQSQTRNKWSKGRPVALKRLKEDYINMDCLTSQDIEIAKKINVETYYSSGYQQTDYSLEANKVISLLVGHPYVFLESDPTTSVELVNAVPELRITHENKTLNLMFYPETDGQKKVVVKQESATRVIIYHLNSSHQTIAKNLRKPVAVPLAGEKQVHQVIDNLKGILTIQSDISDPQANAGSELTADTTAHIHLRSYGSGGLNMLLRMRPFGKEEGPYFKPGVGGKTVMATIKGQSFQVNRNLSAEQGVASSLVKKCPTLSESDTGTWQWIFDETDTALNLLLELQALQDKTIISWPEDTPITLTDTLSINAMSFSVKHKNDWFEAEGQLALDENENLDLRKLLDLVETSPGRFIPLGEKRFLVLTELFRRHLNTLNIYAEKTTKGAKIHPLAAIAMGDFTEGANKVKTDKHWKAHLNCITAGDNLQVDVPSTFQGTLRDYQVQGFQWLMRLAHWQVGACLADDMGLGKTIQALTLILSQAHQGPVLVVAPTSVIFNWQREIDRFAPTLKTKLLAGNNRKQIVENLQAFDLLICSYALLVQERQLLAGVSWKVVVLDEAQAIKNTNTKRSQAAMALSSEFKIILTGTPVENHLGELWNLFRFINPGLLGSLQQFNKRFANPIEQQQDHAKRLALKTLIQPFMLRRLKSQVLEELPAKTRITLEVELNTEEAALYEAIRQQALKKLAGKSQANHIQILAEITRLRRMCCHPSLVMPEKNIPASKLTLLGKILEELLENHHKALVFSQFVDHLSIVSEYLDNQKISYQYLDGKTPAVERRKRIDAFQSGQGSIFLISLKAGGTGLNLTAADYVLHLDPWWNPAVEDQASDRAHRIGQLRPVTVYHFITKNTIEEKIVALHQMKRTLAEDLLSGSHLTGKMSSDELLKLIEQ